VRRPAADGAKRYAFVAMMVAVVTLLHYNTAVHIHEAHGIYRRLYYFPIIFAAFLGGLRASLATALAVCLVYIPHAFGWIGYDPAPTLEKVLEMVLYLAVAAITGILVSRESCTRRSLAATAAGLKSALVEKALVEEQLVREARLAAVGRLSAGLAHEIRNPLSSIKGAAEILADDFPPDHAKGRLLAILQDEAARLNRVLSRFLAFARPQQGDRRPLDLAEELAAAAELVRHREPALRLESRTAAGPQPRISGDREQIRQLLLNLLLNAAEAAGATGRVVAETRVEEGRAVCAVQDDGPGFTAEALASLGTPFFTTREEGTGLGLAISCRIAEDHGGRLEARNPPGGGARVTVTFPLVEQEG
jgi:two-component system sensor histidine kinase HydH